MGSAISLSFGHYIYYNWRVQSSAQKRFTVEAERIAGEGLQHLQLSRESLRPRDR